jgi:F-type H+-transporting ATPase subunit delta
MKLTITTAIELDDKELAKIAERVVEKIDADAEQVEIDHVVNPDVVGGIKLRIGSKTYDATLRRQLEAIKSQLS